MGYRPRYDRGDWSVICDSCGKKFKASSLIKRWDGVQVCSTCWEPRQPQDFVRGVADIQAPAWARPEVANTFFFGSPTAIVGLGVVGFAIVGNNQNQGEVPSGTFTI